MEHLAGHRSRLLLIGDEQKDGPFAAQLLTRCDFPFSAQWTHPSESLDVSSLISDWDLALLISTQRNPATALSLIAVLKPLAQERPVLLCLPSQHDELGASAIDLGIQDYFTPDQLPRFSAAIKRELRNQLCSPRSVERWQFQRILNTASDAIITTDQDSNVLFFNFAAEQIFGYKAHEILGESLELLIPRGSTNTQLHYIDSFSVSQDALNDKRVTFGRRKDGQLFPAEINVSQSGDDHTQRFTAIVRDITDRIELENQLREHASTLEARVEKRTQQLNRARIDAEAVARSKSEFLSIMSHEIRTPLNAIVGLSLMLDRMNLPEKAGELAARIHQSGKRVVTLINEILDLSKLEAHKVEFAKEPFYLGDVLSQVAEMMRTLAAGKSLELAIHPPPLHAQYLLGDPMRLSQILTNLVGNAIKFTHEGEVLLTVDLLSATETTVELGFCVKDTGIGISPDALERLFDPYEQADSSTTRKFGGTGLGLAICKHLVDLQGGQIEVQSEVGVGSEFSFRMHYPLDSDAVPHQTHDQSLTLLFADDCEISREAIRLNTLELGYDPLGFANGAELLRFYTENPQLQNPKTIVILDYYMPNLSGAEVAKALSKRFSPVARPTIIIASAEEPDSFEGDPIFSIADAVVHKTVTSSTLDTIIRRALRHKQGDEDDTEPHTGVSSLAGLKILVVDDNATNLEVAKGLFESEGAVITCLSQGQAAVDWIVTERHSCDLVLMDVSMPGMDGLQATRLIREHFSSTELPIIALSAGTLEIQRQRAADAGMNGFIPKPFELGMAIATVKQTLSHRPLPEPPEQPLDHAPFDLDRALRLFKSEAIYQRYLALFFEESDAQLADLASDQLSLEETAAIAHSIAGSAGNLGLGVVCRCAQALERAALHENALAAPKQQLFAAIQNAQRAATDYLRSALKAQNAQAPEPASTNLDPADIRQLLEIALEGAESYSAAEVEQPIQHLANIAPRPEWTEILNQIQLFDFESVTQTINTLLQDELADL